VSTTTSPAFAGIRPATRCCHRSPGSAATDRMRV
jgi:hypothetical protein